MTNATEQNMASAWIESKPAMVLSKNVEAETTVLNLQFDSMMDFDENQDNIAMNLDGKFLQPGWSIKTEVSDFNQVEGEDGMSNIKADFYLAFNNLDDESLSKRYKIHSFDLWVPAQNRNADGSFNFLSAKDNEKMLATKLKEAFSQAMSGLTKPAGAAVSNDSTVASGPMSLREAHNPFARQTQASQAAPAHVANGKTINLNKSTLGIGLAVLLCFGAAVWAVTVLSKDDNMQTSQVTTTPQHPSETNPLISANTNDPSAQAALNLTKETLEGMGLPVSKTGADLGCLTN